MRSTNRNKKLLKTSMFSTLMKRSQKFVWRLPDKICRLDLKSKKNHENIKSTNQKANFPYKSKIRTLKKER
jgi:hypothetical protein